MENKTNQYTLPKASEEQINVITYADSNIIVDSVAGSGKTTTILHLAQTMSIANPYDLILLLTYNKKLKLETRKKIELLNLRNIEAHSYHSAAVKYYDHKCFDDYNLMNVVDSLESKKLPRFTRIIIDEAQDMTELYYKFVCIIVRDLQTYSGVHKNNIKFSIIGDKFQSIFAFNGADKRFIQYADLLFSAFSGIPYWKSCKLSTSYRITKTMANFINNVALKNDRLQAIKHGPPVEYIICNTFGQYPSQLIHSVLNEKDSNGKQIYQNSDIFILAPSVKSSKSPVRKVANYLSALKFSIFVPGSDEEPLDEDVLKGKIVFSTLHQVKGLERKCVFLFGFDQSYFEFFGKSLNKEICPNTLYVALTRSLEKMYLFHHNGHEYLSFLDTSQLNQFAKVTVKEKMHPTVSKSITTIISVSDLTRHVSAKVIYDALGFFSYADEHEPGYEIEIPIRIDGAENKNNDVLTETVADINGVALASYYEFATNGNMQILDELFKETDATKIAGLVVDKKDPMNYSFDMTPENLLKLANAYCSHRTEYIYKMNQINKYDWLTEQHLSASVDRMKTYLSENCLYELPLCSPVNILGKTLKGRIDIFDKGAMTIWEIKAVKNLKFEHLIQTVIYGWMFGESLKNFNFRTKYEFKEIPEIKCKIFNILNGHIIEVKFDPDLIQGMLEMIIYAKYFDGRSSTDDKFITDLLGINAEYSKAPNEKNKNARVLQKIVTKEATANTLKMLDDDFVF